MNKINYYRVPLYLGEKLREIPTHTDCPIKIVNISDTSDAFIITKKPLIPEYKDAQHGFILPPTIFLSVKAEHGKVVDISTSPQLDYLTINDMLQVLKKLIITFDSVGWQRNRKAYHTELEELPKLYQNSTVNVYTIERWQLGSKEILLSVERTMTAAEMKHALPLHPDQHKDQFLINVNITDYPELRKQ